MDTIIEVDSIPDLEYLSMVLLEALRIRPPGPGTTFLMFTQDTTLGVVKVLAGDPFRVDFLALHYDESQW